MVTVEPKLEAYVMGAKVKLTVTPNDGWLFTGWGGRSKWH